MATGNDPQGKSVTVQGAATLIANAGARTVVKVKVPTGGGIVYVGGDDVATTSYPVSPATADEFTIEGGNLYGIVATFTTTVTVFVSRR